MNILSSHTQNKRVSGSRDSWSSGFGLYNQAMYKHSTLNPETQLCTRFRVSGFGYRVKQLCDAIRAVEDVDERLGQDHPDDVVDVVVVHGNPAVSDIEG